MVMYLRRKGFSWEDIIKITGSTLIFTFNFKKPCPSLIYFILQIT